MRRMIAIRYLGQFGLVLLLLPAASVGAGSFLVVNFGAHPSPEEAGLGELRSIGSMPIGRATCRTACFAALELQRYLRKLTGRADDFSIVDDDSPPQRRVDPGRRTGVQCGQPAVGCEALGINAATGYLGPEGYRLKTAAVNGRRVLIAGGGRIKDTLYGRANTAVPPRRPLVALGELHEEVPSVQRMVGDVDVTQRPAFATRGFLAWQDRGDREFLLWMAHNRQQVVCRAERSP